MKLTRHNYGFVFASLPGDPVFSEKHTAYDLGQRDREQFQQDILDLLRAGYNVRVFLSSNLTPFPFHNQKINP